MRKTREKFSGLSAQYHPRPTMQVSCRLRLLGTRCVNAALDPARPALHFLSGPRLGGQPFGNTASPHRVCLPPRPPGLSADISGSPTGRRFPPLSPGLLARRGWRNRIDKRLVIGDLDGFRQRGFRFRFRWWGEDFAVLHRKAGNRVGRSEVGKDQTAPQVGNQTRHERPLHAVLEKHRKTVHARHHGALLTTDRLAPWEKLKPKWPRMSRLIPNPPVSPAPGVNPPNRGAVFAENRLKGEVNPPPKPELMPMFSKKLSRAPTSGNPAETICPKEEAGRRQTNPNRGNAPTNGLARHADSPCVASQNCEPPAVGILSESAREINRGSPGASLRR